MRWLKPMYLKCHIFQILIKTNKLKVSISKQNRMHAISITTAVTTLRDIFFGHEKPTYEKQHVQPVEPNLIQQADDLYTQNRYVEAYELLNKLRFCSDVEVLWRISRALFAMSQNESITTLIREEMLNEAYQLIRIALANQENNANVQKWMAILLDSTAGYVNTYTRIQVMLDVKKHLLRATQLDPNDAVTLYMLGHWCYQLASLTWFQRKLAGILFASPPTASYDEAYNYFIKAEQLSPRFFIGNIYMLGKISYHMKQCYRAKYYLDIAANLPCKTVTESWYNREARKLSSELEHFDLSKNALFYEG